MKKLLIALAVVVVLLIAAVIAIPLLIPVETFKQQFVQQVRSATGRELTIGGPIKISLFPRLELEVSDVAFANPPGAVAKEMAKLGRLQLRLMVMPLLSGEMAVDSFVLVDPVIRLEVDKQGRPNWVFGEPAAPAAKPGEPAVGRDLGLRELRLGDIRLVNGTLGYLDQRSGARQELTNVNMQLALPGLDNPFAARGGLTWNGKKVDLAADIAKPRDLLAGRPSAVALKVGSEPVNVDFKGAVTNAEPMKIDGDVDLKVPSVRALAAWTGNPIEAPGKGLGPLAIKGKLNATGALYSFRQAEIALDEIKAKGELSVDAGKAKPYLKGQLDVERLDLNPYLPPEQPPAAAGKPAAGSPAGAPAAAGWSNEPIDISGLKAANADFAFAAGAILVRKIQIGRSSVALSLKEGRLVADLKELALYQGNGQGRMVVDGSGAVPAIDYALKLAGVQAEPLLRDAADFERLSGTAAADIAVNGRGRSQRELVGALQGKGSVRFTDGAIKGLNIAAMVRNVQGAFLDPGAKAPQQTDFTELGGTYTITNGILKNSDLQMMSPLLRVTGAGTVDLPRRTVDYRLEPKAVATIEGQRGREGLAGVMVPVIIQGPWDNLSYRPDLAGAIKEQLPGKALEGLKGVVPGLPGAAKPPAPAGTTGDAAPAPPSAPVEGLKKLFGR
jgi:AsmA protein